MIKPRYISRTGLATLMVIAFAMLVFGQSDKVVKARGYASATAVKPGDKIKLAVALEIDEGYHINAHKPSLEYLQATTVQFEAPSGIRIGEPRYPGAMLRKFEFAPETELAVHEGIIFVTAEAEADKSIKPGDSVIHAQITVQSCNDKLCLAPADLALDIPIRVVAAGQAVEAANADVFAKASSQPDSASVAESSAGLVEYQGGSNSVADKLATGGIVSVLLGVFFAGLLLNTTPCVYPIIPITIGFFVNQSASQEGKPKISKTFFMASMYVLGMALTYSLLGVIAAKSGGLFGALLQNAIVLIVLAGLMIALSLSMFGVYEFKLPESLNRMATSSTQSTSGLLGAFVMGLTMGIVAAPCIGPFVLGLLVHVGTKGSAAYGFMLFFVLALGLGLPYLVLGTFSGALKTLPRSGMWMVTVRKVFGLVLIGMALYFLMPLMGTATTKYVFIAFFAGSSLYLLFWEAGRTKPKQFGWVLRAIGVGAAAVAIVMALPKKIEAEIPWQPYSEQALAEARSSGHGVIIDTFADWCIPCKELDQATFTDAAVKTEAERFVTLKLDLTRSDAGSEAARAKARFGIRGVPTVIFLDGAGREKAELRLEGFEKPNSFLARMKQVEFSAKPGDPKLALAPASETSARADATSGSAAASAEPLPPAVLSLLDGGTLDLHSKKGKVLLIDFWATWCLPCISEIPIFNQLDKDYKARGFEVIAVSLDEDGAAKVKPFLKQHPMNYTQTIGDAKVSGALGVGESSLPVALLVDKQGNIRFRHVGRTEKDVFEAEIKLLLNE